MLDEGTLVILGIILVATLAWLIGTVLGLSTRIDGVKRNLELEFKVELGKSELKNKYLDKTYTIRDNEYTVVDIVLDELYNSSGLFHTEYIIKLMDTNGFRISLNHRQFEYFIEEMDNDDTNKGDKQLYDWLKNHEDTSDILDKAWLDRFIVSEDEQLYYALIKGHELSSNELKYWSCKAYNSGDLLIDSKNPKDSCINRMTKNNWNKLGISSSNADFVVE